MSERKISDPYVGPRPFTRDQHDQNRFFGRDEEADEIVSLILGHRLVLIYAQSGAGKTSIFEAQVAPMLQKYGFEVLPRARVGTASETKIELTSVETSETSSTLVNYYLLNAFQSLVQVDPKLLQDKSLFEFLNHFFPSDDKGNNKPQVLVFDQFEELFTFYPGKTWRQQQENFFEQVAEVLEKTSELRIVFAIREDYLAELDCFMAILPERLRPRFRLERLQKDASLLAIKGPLEGIGNDTIATKYSTQEIDSQIEMLVEELLKIQVEDPFSGKPYQLDGQFVEPIQLQIVCQKWWHDLSLGKLEPTQARLKALANVDTALREFYEGIVHDASKLANVDESIVRRLCEEKLITSSGTRAFVHRGAFAQNIGDKKWKVKRRLIK